MEFRPWTLMYIGAAVSVVICVYLIYVITNSGDPSIEWIVWIFFGLTTALAVGGFFYENKYKRKHGDPRLSEYKDILEDESSPTQA